MIKFNHLWYLLHICCDFAILVNPFFRAVRKCFNKHIYLISSGSNSSAHKTTPVNFHTLCLSLVAIDGKHRPMNTGKFLKPQTPKSALLIPGSLPKQQMNLIQV